MVQPSFRRMCIKYSSYTSGDAIGRRKAQPGRPGSGAPCWKGGGAARGRERGGEPGRGAVPGCSYRDRNKEEVK